MKSSPRRSRRQRNQQNPEKKPFFSKANKTGIQTKEKNAFFQPKLAIGQPGDKYEQEADAMADTVVNKSGSTNIQQKKDDQIQRVTLASPEKDEKLGTAEQRMEEDKMIQEKPEEEEVQMQQEEEEPVQMMGEEEEESVQMQEEEEEPVQMKGEEEEEALQMQEEEEEALQAKSDPAHSGKASNQLSTNINNKKGKGKPLPDQTRSEMENAFGVDFSGVNIHTDRESVQMNKELGAQAFTTGKDVYFNTGKYRPETSKGKHLLAHELTHVVQQGKAKDKNIQKRELNGPEKTAAISGAKTKLDGASVRSIQRIVGLAGNGIDGDFGPITAKAVSDWQGTKGIADNGLINETTLDKLISALNTSQTRRHEAIHLVVDYYGLNVSSNTLTIYASRSNSSSTTFESGLQVIKIGKTSFTDTATLKLAITTELAKADPNAITGPVAPATEILSAAQKKSAIAFMKSKFKDYRSIFVLQYQLGAMPNGTVDEDFVQRIAKAQQDDGTLDVDGKVGRNTLEFFFKKLRDGGEQNAAIRLILDYYRIKDHGNLTAVYYDSDPSFDGYAATSRNPKGPVRVRIRRALYQPFEAMVHSINHEFEHVRQHKVGILDSNTREFLGEVTEIISKGMQDETLFNVSVADASGTIKTNKSGLYDDAGRCIKNWNRMPLADRKKNWTNFAEVRKILRGRVAGTYNRTKKQDKAAWAAASATDKAKWTARITAYNAINKPR